MTSFGGVRGGVRAGLAALSVAAIACWCGAAANEPKPDVEVSMRLVGTTSSGSGAAVTGIARVEVTIEALRATRVIALEVVRPDGTPWPLRGVRVDVPRDGLAVPARGSARSLVEVPLAGEAMHEIVLRVDATIGGTPVAAESRIVVPLGAPAALPVDDGTYANVPVKEVR